jgi:hypothetical protein
MPDLSTILTDLQSRRKEIQHELHSLESAISALKEVSTGGSQRTAGVRRRPRLSAAARKRIADAQRARWAKVRAQQKRSA